MPWMELPRTQRNGPKRRHDAVWYRSTTDLIDRIMDERIHLDEKVWRAAGAPGSVDMILDRKQGLVGLRGRSDGGGRPVRLSTAHNRHHVRINARGIGDQFALAPLRTQLSFTAKIIDDLILLKPKLDLRTKCDHCHGTGVNSG